MTIKPLTYSELLYNLKNDKKLKIVFVEGNRDLSFWRRICPINERINCVVYSINSIEINCEYGGNKGRLVKLAQQASEQGFNNRVKIFLDADYDHIIPKKYPDNIVLTDWRDLESYAFNQDTINELVSTGLAKEVDASLVLSQLYKLSYPIGIIRIISESNSLELPFQTTFKNLGRKKILKKQKDMCIDVSKLVSKLLQNAKISLKKHDEIMDQYKTIANSHNKSDSRYILHGKDWAFYLSCFYEVNPKHIDSLIFLSMDYNKISESNNISIIKNYLSSAPM